MIEQLQAVVDDASGIVTNVIVCTQDVATLFESFDPPVFPGATLTDCTGLGVGVGWTHAATRDPAFRPPQPTPDATWNNDSDTWDVPPPPPQPDPEPDPGAPSGG